MGQTLAIRKFIVKAVVEKVKCWWSCLLAHCTDKDPNGDQHVHNYDSVVCVNLSCNYTAYTLEI